MERKTLSSGYLCMTILRAELPLVSASQVKLYLECPRKWAWRYLQKIEMPQHPAAALGTEVDDEQLQPYLRDGRPLDFTRESGHIAAAGLAWLPEPKLPGLKVQKHFVMPSPTWRDGQHIGFGYQGYIDLWLPDSSAVPGMPGGAPFVGDFKTTSNLKWAKTEEELKTDVQAMLYATYAVYETKAKSVDLAWMYFQTRGPKRTKRVVLRVLAEEAFEQFDQINNTAIEMFKVRGENPHPKELEPVLTACSQYGGCPYKDRCELSPAQIIEAEEAADMQRQGTDGRSVSMTNADDLLASLKARKAAIAGAAQVSLEDHVAKNPRAAFLLEQPAPINPPESTLPPPPAVEATTPPVEVKKRGRPAAKKDPVAADMAAAVATPIVPPAAPPQPVVKFNLEAQIVSSLADVYQQLDAIAARINELKTATFKKASGE